MESTSLTWRKARRSGASGNCVELAVDGQEVLVRDSKNPGGGHLSLRSTAWAQFVRSLRG